VGEWGTRPPVEKSGGRRPPASPPHYTPVKQYRIHGVQKRGLLLPMFRELRVCWLNITSVREYVVYVFFRFQKNVSRKTVVSRKQMSSGNIGQCQILEAVKMNNKY